MPASPESLELADAVDRPAGHSRRAGVTRALDALVAVMFAPQCAACTRVLEHPTRGPVCEDCWRAVLPLTPPVCDICGDPLPSWRLVSIPLARCPRCRRRQCWVDRARSAGPFQGALRLIIHAFKYDARRSLARPLGSLMRLRGGEVLAGADVAVPIPLHPSRRRQRGFNQASDLARHVGLPVTAALRRIRATASQADLPSAQRHRNVRGAFDATRNAAALSGRIVVLIDDVSTTGATLEACARVLKELGVREVRALTAARVATGLR
jgi:ComF family protein